MWTTYCKYGLHTANVDYILQIWTTYCKYGLHTANVDYILQIWTTLTRGHRSLYVPFSRLDTCRHSIHRLAFFFSLSLRLTLHIEIVEAMSDFMLGTRRWYITIFLERPS
jgi:uncharacterized protein YbdZ (MbtH family)